MLVLGPKWINRGHILKKPTKKLTPGKKNVTEDRSIPVWLQATRTFYKKLNRVATECGLTRYEVLNRGMDAFLRETRKERSPLNKAIKTGVQVEAFRKTMGSVSRKYWATLSSEEKRARAQNSANARWNNREKAKD
jgi:hypothetical protein